MKYSAVGLFYLLVVVPPVYGELSLDQNLATLQSMTVGDDRADAAGKAAQALQTDAPQEVFKTLAAMKLATPIGKNWLSAVACSQYQKSDAAKIASQLESFFQDQTQDPEARTLVFHWLTDGKPQLRIDQLNSMTNDTSPELRYAAIEQALSKLNQENPDEAQLNQLLDSARHPDQVRNIIKLLSKLGKTVDQAKHFGFIKEWNLIGPFDYSQPDQFDAAYPVEKDLLAGDFEKDKTYIGKENAKVQWRQFHTDDEEGKVNLAELYEKEKSAAIYGYATFDVDHEQPALVSLTTVNGNKTWLNGQPVMSNNVFHVGARLDQYVEPVQLKAGKNTIVFKIMQNDQPEPWAQEYQFHCRIADPTFKGLQFSQVN